MGLAYHNSDPRGDPWGDPKVVYLILMTEMVMVGDSYEQRFWKWSGMLSGTTDWAWDVTMVILGEILGVILILLMILLNILCCGPRNVLLNVY